MNHSLPQSSEERRFVDQSVGSSRNPLSNNPSSIEEKKHDQSINQPANQSINQPKPKTFWQRYRGLIIVLIVLFVVFIIVVVVMIIKRKRSGPSLPPGVKMTQSHANDFSDKLQEFKDASDEIRREVADLPPPKPLV